MITLIKNLKKLICYTLGHKYNNIALEHGYLDCGRCHKSAHYDEDLEGEECYIWWHKKIWRIKEFYRNLKWKIRNWWKYKVKKEDDSVPF